MRLSFTIKMVSDAFAKPKPDPNTISSAISGWANAGAWLMSADHYFFENMICSNADEPVCRETADQLGLSGVYGERQTKDQREPAKR